MSTRSNIHFVDEHGIAANIYRHSDGYPGNVEEGQVLGGGVLGDLLKFFRKLKAEVPDNRLNSPEQLAAKYLVWQSQELTKYGRIYDPAEGPRDEDGRGPAHPLQFLGVSPCMQDHGDIEYVYEIDCDKQDREGFPVIRWASATPFLEIEPTEGDWTTVYLTGDPAKAA